MDSRDTAEATRFRLLIIGKTGCGKTTILSKVRTILFTRVDYLSGELTAGVRGEYGKAFMISM